MEKEKNQENEKLETGKSETIKEPGFFIKNILFIILLISNFIPIWLHADYTKTDMIVHWVLVIISILCIILRSIKKINHNHDLVVLLIICMFFSFTLWDSGYNHIHLKAYKQVDLEDALDYFYTSEYYDGNIIKTYNFEKYSMIMTDQYIVTINNEGVQSAFEYDINQAYDIDISTIEAYDYEVSEMDMNYLQIWFYCYIEDDHGIEYNRISIVGYKENSKYPVSFEKKEYYIGQKDQDITKEYLINFETAIQEGYYEIVDASLINKDGVSGVVLGKDQANENYWIVVYDDQTPVMNCIGGIGSYGSICDDTTIKVDEDTITIGPILEVDNDEEKYVQIVATYNQENNYYDFKTERIK